MKKKILITGSNGLLGQKLLDLFQVKSNFDIIATSKGKNRYPNNPFTYEDLDITDKLHVNNIIDYYKPDFIINTAAMTNVDACEDYKKECDDLNVNAVRYLIDSCKKHDIHLIHISTDFIFDGKNGPYKETDIANPISYYGLSKWKAEEHITFSAINFPASSTFPPPAVIIASQLLFLIILIMRNMSSSQQSYFSSAKDFFPCTFLTTSSSAPESTRSF